MAVHRQLERTPPPDFDQTSQAMDLTGERYDQELDAEIQTLVLINVDRFKDLQKARKDDHQKNGPVIHSVAEFSLKKGAPLLDTIGQKFAGQPLVTMEMEVVNFNLSAFDDNIFLVPPEFEQVDMHELLVQQDIRANYQ